MKIQSKKTSIFTKQIMTLGVLTVTATSAVTADTTSTDNAVFQPGPSIDSPEIVNLGGLNIDELPPSTIGYAPTERIDISGLVVDTSHGTDTAIIAGNETLKQRQDLHNAQLAYMMKLKQIPVQAVRDLKTPRFAPGTSEIEIYKLTIAFHQRAIAEGLPLSAYIDWINQGHPSAKKWIKDAVNCGPHFLVYPDSNICSEFYSIQDYAENFYWAKYNKEYFETQWKAAKETISQLSAFGAHLIQLLGSK